ncbi:FtsX-like permease family protein [Streptomyces sp. NPDC090741]|uniref:ABC transporter permease n=1 Tax=Streptomyces sp. NPDC090741 TaxID=3365967 RepID=UPI00382E9AD4
MSGLGKVVRSGVRRRKVHTLVTGLATMMAVTASVLGGSLLVASTGPFDQAFARQHGAHLTAQFDASRTTAAQLSASAHAAGVTAASGPFQTATINPQGGSDLEIPTGMSLPPMTVVGRADPGGPVDDVTLLQGTWVSGPGQVVLSSGYGSPVKRVGTTLRFPDLPGAPTLTVVGFAQSVSRTAGAWVAPSEIASLTAPGAAGGYQMLYRFAAAGTAAQIEADRAAVMAATPAGALAGVQSWLNTKEGTDRNTALFVPFLIAFGLLGVLMSVLIVGNVVAGAVGTGTRRIGILKALGFTPAQVVRSYMGQALIPAAVGTAIGALAGNALAVPVLSTTAQVYGTTTAGVAPWVDLAVIAGALGMVTVTAWAAALRAGRLRTVDALTVGRTPRTGRGRRAARLTARLPLPRPVSLGLAHPFARPARTAGMIAAIVFGGAAATFAVGMAASLSWVQTAKNHDTADVVIQAFGPPPAPGPGRPGPPAVTPATTDPAAITAAVNAQSGTQEYYGTANTDVTIAGVSGSTTVFTFTGDSTWAGYKMVSGSWFHGPGEAVAPSTFMTATATRIGDTVTLHDHGKAIPVRIVGEVFDPHTQTNEVLTDAATLTVAETDLNPASYHIKVKPGTNVAAYVDTLNISLKPLGVSAVTDQAEGSSDVILALDTLTAVLTLMLVTVAGLGVLNTVVLETRERVRDIGVAKALGMTPSQTISMILAAVVVVGLVGGAIGLPAGLALHAVTVPAMGRSAGLHFPASAINVYPVSELILLGLGGLLIAVLGALMPATWAARTRTVTALRTE